MVSLLLTFALAGCGDKDADTGGGSSTSDAGTTDGGTSDGGTSDGGTSDGGTSDGGISDGGTSDGGTSDGGTSDGGTSDGGTTDGDGDGFTSDEDCDDDDPTVRPDAVEDCDDGIDSDCDGLLDCEDGDCADDSDCDEDCEGGLDEDGDGLIDCLDDDCETSRDCVEDCSNGVDDDGDGAIDCDDGYCADADVCLGGSSRVNAGSMHYRSAWDLTYGYRNVGVRDLTFTLQDLSMSVRFWSASSWQTCQWGADQVTLRHDLTFAGGSSSWGHSVESSGTWSDGCPTGVVPALDFALDATSSGSGHFSACRIPRVWGLATSYAPGCSAEAWLSGTSTGFDQSTRSSTEEWWPKKGSGYVSTFIERTTTLSVPELQPGPWGLEE